MDLRRGSGPFDADGTPQPARLADAYSQSSPLDIRGRLGDCGAISDEAALYITTSTLISLLGELEAGVALPPAFVNTCIVLSPTDGHSIRPALVRSSWLPSICNDMHPFGPPAWTRLRDNVWL